MARVILFGGDPHGDFEPAREACLRLRPSALVLLGDLDLERPLHEEMSDVIAAGVRLFWIPGNHDGDSAEWYERCFAPPSGDWNIHGRVVNIEGVRVAGFGGVFRGRTWRPPDAPRIRRRIDLSVSSRWRASWESEDGLPPRQRVSIWPEDYDATAKLAADILVTHEAPSICATERGQAAGFGAIDDLALAMGVKTIVHGHHHRDYEAVLGTGIRVFGLGLASVRDSFGRLLVPGKPLYTSVAETSP